MSDIRHYRQLGYTVRVKKTPYYWEFKVFRILFQEPQILWDDKDKAGSPNPVDSLERAELFLHGQIKWDGCSNWHFDKQDQVMLHFCDVEQAGNIGVLFRRMYEWAATEMQEVTDFLDPNWNVSGNTAEALLSLTGKVDDLERRVAALTAAGLDLLSVAQRVDEYMDDDSVMSWDKVRAACKLLGYIDG